MGPEKGTSSHLPSINPLDPSELKELLQAEGFQPTKRLGQHFLISERVVRLIDQAVGENAGSVLEVGPGPGALTHLLSARLPVLALEVDERVIAILRQTAPDAEVMLQDALEADLGSLVQNRPTPRVLVSNMPYNITGPLLTAFTRARTHFDRMVLMMQREVAEKIMARDGDSSFGSISVFLQSRFEIRIVCQAPAGAFWPPPKVDSSVLTFKATPVWATEEAHERVVRLGFGQPRKTLSNNILAGGWSREIAEAALTAVGLDLRVRPHQVSLAQWSQLAEFLHDH